MPAPVRTGAMFKPNACSTISSATPLSAWSTTLLMTEPERARALGALERVQRRAAIQLVLEAA